MCHAKQDDDDDDDGQLRTPTRPGFYRHHVDNSPPHPPWTYPFDSAYEYDGSDAEHHHTQHDDDDCDDDEC